MKKFNRGYIWICIIIFQIIIGVGTGFLALSAVETGVILNDIKIEDLDLKGKSLNEAKAIIEEYYSSLPNNNLTFNINNHSFIIPYSDIEARVDVEKTIDAVKDIIPENGFNQLFANYDKEYSLNPVIVFNKEKLQNICEPIFTSFERPSVNARYDIEEGILVYTPQIPGVRVDFEKLTEQIERHLNISRYEPFNIDDTSLVFADIYNPEIYETEFSVIVSKAQIPFLPETEMRKYLNPLHGVVFDNNAVINLKDLLDFSQFKNPAEKDILNRIATGIYQSALCIEGMEILERTPSRQPVLYTETGLEAVIDNDNQNLVMINKTSAPLMLLIETRENTVVFNMVSDKELKNGMLVVKKEEEIPPPIVTSVNDTLSPNEKKLVSEGIPGFTVSVSLIIENDRIELYKDKYDPISKVIEVGKNNISVDK